jgi:DNA repair protein RadC
MDELIHKGHRERMRRKFSEYGPRVFDTYELLEMLLYNTVPVKDTNPIAKKLLARFGSLDGVLSAEKSELMEVDGIGDRSAELIRTVGEALSFSINRSESDEFIPETYDDFGMFFADYFSGIDSNMIVLMSLDNGLRIMGVDVLFDCDYSSAKVKPKPFIDCVVRRGASVAIVAHNHPFGAICPSEGDRQTNLLIENALFGVGISLAEHYVVSGSKYVGFMNHLKNAFAQKPALEKFYESKRCSRNDE